MRVADVSLANTFLNSVNRTKEEIQKLQIQLATNSKINKPSDDPSGMSRSLRLAEQIQNNDTYTNNIDTSLSFLEQTTSSLELILDEIESIDVSLSTLNNPVNSSASSTIADQIAQSVKSILSAANAEFEGKYILGGTDFSEAPYGFTDDTETAVEMKVANTSGEMRIRISKSYTQQVNITGDELFGDIDGTDIFNRLLQLSATLKSGGSASEQDVENIKSFRVKLLSKITNAGEITVRLENTAELLKSQNTQLQSLLSEQKDVDAVAAITELQNQQYFLERSYQMSSMILPQSLLDFL